MEALNNNLSSKVNEENWGFCGYKSANLQVFITMSAIPSPQAIENTEEVLFLYSITVLDEDFQEVFQQDFENLSEALKQINKRYAHWEFINREEAKGGGGCGTCSAH